MELDGRPKELTEYILKTRLEECPCCGYIAEDIREKTSINQDFLQSPDYCSLNNHELPLSPSLYLRAALIQIVQNNLQKAIDYYISAAWCADDLLNHDLAVSCRIKALSLIFADNKTFANIPSKKWIPVLDTMRRSGDFDGVITQCTSLLAIAGPTLEQGLKYEILCAKGGDSKPHTNLDAANSNQNWIWPHEADEELVIDGKSYSALEDCHGNGWNWEARTHTLVLSNYHGSSIEAYGDITIRLDQVDNQIKSSHGPGIHIHHGNLKIISGPVLLSITGNEDGIIVDSGALEITGPLLVIRTKSYGIFASGMISTQKSVIDVRSETTAIKSASGGLNATNHCVLKIYGLTTGIDVAADSFASEVRYQIESPNGVGIICHSGSLTFTESVFDIVCGSCCILLENGVLNSSSATGILNGISGMQINGSCNIEKSNITISGEDFGLFVSKSADIVYTIFQSSGKTAIAIEENLQINNVNLTASGSVGISVGGDIKCAGGSVKLEGDTAMQITGNAEIIGSVVIGIGKICGIVVNGSYFQSGGDISFTGEAQDGMRILGKEMRITEGGVISISGQNYGVDVTGDVVMEAATLSVSGNTGFSCHSLEIKFVSLKVAGEEIGLSMRGGNLVIGDAVHLNATGNVGIFTTNDIEITNGFFHVTGQFGGIVMERGNLIITNGVIEISGDEYGILLQSGSMYVSGGMTTITNSRMTDLGGCGIAIEKGNLDAGSILTVNGESYAISVPCGDITLKGGKIEAYGYRAGIIGKSLILQDVILTAYGKTEEAVALTGKGPWNDEGVITLTGKSNRKATNMVYSGQRFVHAYTVHISDVS